MLFSKDIKSHFHWNIRHIKRMCYGEFRLKKTAASPLTEKLNNSQLSLCHIWLCTSPQYFCQFVRALFKMCQYLYLFFYPRVLCMWNQRLISMCWFIVSPSGLFLCILYVHNILIDRIQKPLIKKTENCN